MLWILFLLTWPPLRHLQTGRSNTSHSSFTAAAAYSLYTSRTDCLPARSETSNLRLQLCYLAVLPTSRFCVTNAAEKSSVNAQPSTSDVRCCSLALKFRASCWCCSSRMCYPALGSRGCSRVADVTVRVRTSRSSEFVLCRRRGGKTLSKLQN